MQNYKKLFVWQIKVKKKSKKCPFWIITRTFQSPRTQRRISFSASCQNAMCHLLQPAIPPSIYSTRHYHKLPFIFFTIFLLHNSWVPSAQQLMGICTTPDMRAHNSCCAVGDINLSKNRHYIFRQLLLLL